MSSSCNRKAAERAELEDFLTTVFNTENPKNRRFSQVMEFEEDAIILTSVTTLGNGAETTVKWRLPYKEIDLNSVKEEAGFGEVTIFSRARKKKFLREVIRGGQSGSENTHKVEIPIFLGDNKASHNETLAIAAKLSRYLELRGVKPFDLGLEEESAGN